MGYISIAAPFTANDLRAEFSSEEQSIRDTMSTIFSLMAINRDEILDAMSRGALRYMIYMSKFPQVYHTTIGTMRSAIQRLHDTGEIGFRFSYYGTIDESGAKDSVLAMTW